MKVTVLDDYQHAFQDLHAIERLRQKTEVQIFTEKFASDEALIQALRGSQAIIPIRERTHFPAPLLKSLPDLEIIAQTGGHAYHIDIAGATLVLGRVLRGKTLGILGLGKVGSAVSRLAQAFGMKVIAWGPTLTTERAQKAGVTYMALEEVLRAADVVSVHLKLSDQSRGLLNETRLRLMKKSAYLVNTARGAMIDEKALVKVLKEKAIAGAALDVFVEEPLPPGSPLLELDNVVLSPHLGWPTDSGFEGFAENAVENILNYMEGKLTRATNPEALERRNKIRSDG